jgi:transcriptional regulator with XRE-family HTH domain
MVKGVFGETLKAERDRLHISQDALAEQLGVSQQAVANWENGKSQPRPAHRTKLLEILGYGSKLPNPSPPPNFLAQFVKPGGVNPSPSLPPHTIERARKHSQQEMRDLQDLYATLPERLRPYIGAGIRIGATQRRIDYLSDNVGAEVKRVPTDWLRTWHSFVPEMLNLTMIRQATHGVFPDRKYILLVIQDGDTPGQALQRIMFDGGVLGVWVTPVLSITEAARLIEKIETSDFIAPNDSDIMAQVVENAPPTNGS